MIYTLYDARRFSGVGNFCSTRVETFKRRYYCFRKSYNTMVRIDTDFVGAENVYVSSVLTITRDENISIILYAIDANDKKKTPRLNISFCAGKLCF